MRWKGWIRLLTTGLTLFILSLSFLSAGAYGSTAYWADPAAGTKINSYSVPQGEQIHLILKAEIPESKILKAYNFKILYDSALASLLDANRPSESSFPPTNINKEVTGEITINSFNTDGVAGPATISLLDLTLTAIAEGTFTLGIQVNNFGTSSSDIFPPTPEVAQIEIRSCTVSNAGIEVCDEVDNDCDGQIDEGFDLQTDPNNCGVCGNKCRYTHAANHCVNGTCSMGACDNGYYNLNNDPSDGCEYACTMNNGGIEICDGFDNNCDGSIDEGFSKETDPQNCGSCGHACPSYPHATAICSNGQCTMGSCDAGWQDQDEDAGNGCEYCENCQEPGGCLFRAAITAIGQDLSGANNASTVYLGIAENAVTYPTPGYQPNYTVDMRLTGDLLEDIVTVHGQ